jgi:transcriptional regulator with XRE-family HTH domain
MPSPATSPDSERRVRTDREPLTGGAPIAAVASCGIPALDELLHGILWGDNVVLRIADPEADAAAYRRAFASAEGYGAVGVVAFPGGEAMPAVDGPRLETGGDGIDDAIDRVLAFGLELGAAGLVVVDDLARLVELHGEDGARRFFTRVCPRLLRLGLVACWTLGPGVGDELVEDIRRVTQIVIRVEPGQLVVVKAEARPLDVTGKVLAISSPAEDGQAPVVEAITDASRLGSALAAVRTQRGLSQAEFSRLAGVSPSAISQAERGHRGLSVSTLLRLASALGIPLDELVVGGGQPGYRIHGRTMPHRGGASRVALVDSAAAPLRLYEFRLDAGAQGSPPAQRGGSELVLLGQGLLLVTMTDGTTPVIREGEALVAASSAIAGWRNLDEDQAIGFWLVV